VVLRVLDLRAEYDAAMLILTLLLLPLGCSGSKVTSVESSECDGELQGGETGLDAPYDQDGDGYFDRNISGCVDHYPPEQLDCNDSDPAINAGAEEVPCDGVDNDCSDETPDSVDADYDGFLDCDECDDSDPEINPDAPELPCDGVDNDCDPSTTDATDYDEDGYDTCEDCNDSDEAINPGVAEVYCNGRDDDCDDATPDTIDADKDGVDICDDCDDNDPDRAPATLEVCGDGVDQDCDEEIDEGC
jgi:hypothetical protein